jgi:hypothetical protein
MRTRFTGLLLAAGMALVPLYSAQAQSSGQGGEPCSGHRLLSSPRPETSCLTIKPRVFASPDRAVRAVIFPVDVDLNVTPDMESRVVLRGPDAKLLTSKDYSSPRGANGYYVVRAEWSPDSQFFVYSLSSSGGHSPWSFPIWVYSREKNLIYGFTDLIGGKPTLSEEFSFSGRHTLKAATWEKEGSDKQLPVAVDLEGAIRKAAEPSE